MGARNEVVEPLSVAMSMWAIEKLADKLLERSGSIFSGGPEGLSLKETAEKFSLGDPLKREELEKTLYRWLMSESFKKIVEQARGGGIQLSVDVLLESLVKEHLQLENAGDVVSYLLRSITVHLSAEDKIFAERTHADRYEELLSQVQAMRQATQQIVAMSLLSEEQEANAVLRGELNTCKKLIDSEKINTARPILAATRNAEDSSKYSKGSLARISNLLGVCALRLNELDVADVEFEQACTLDPKNGHPFANKATVLLLRGKAEDALQYSQTAIANAPDDSSVIASHILVLSELGKYDEIDGIVSKNASLMENASCLLALGQNAINKGDFALALRFFELGCEKEPASSQLRFLLARALFLPIQRESLLNTPLTMTWDPSTKGSLERVVLVLSKSLELIEQQDYQINKPIALINRAAVKTFLGDLMFPRSCGQ